MCFTAVNYRCGSAAEIRASRVLQEAHTASSKFFGHGAWNQEINLQLFFGSLFGFDIARSIFDILKAPAKPVKFIGDRQECLSYSMPTPIHPVKGQFELIS